MTGRKFMRLSAAALAAWLLAAGCSGILLENQDAEGRVQRLRLDGGESWSDLDTTPRYRSQKGKVFDDYSIMLKNEATF